MCNANCILFAAINLLDYEIRGKDVIEVGSLDINGSVRPFIMKFKPSKYIGIDLREGPGVDIVCDAINLVEKFGKESFEIVISTELLEHVKEWRTVISNIKNLCKSNGIILLTTRSYGFDYHDYPYDYWRFELEDMVEIFSDCDIISLEKDLSSPGLFIKVKKPKIFLENDLSSYKLYSVITGKRVKDISDIQLKNFHSSEKLFSLSNDRLANLKSELINLQRELLKMKNEVHKRDIQIDRLNNSIILRLARMIPLSRKIRKTLLSE